MTRTLSAYLADLPEEALQDMLGGVQASRAKLREDDERLAVEEQLITNALARKARRKPSSGGTAKLSRDDIYNALPVGRFSVKAADDALRTHGIETARNNLRQHLRRLVEKDGRLQRDGDYYVKLGSPNGRASQTSPNAAATAEGEEREMSLMDGSQDGPG